MSESDGPDVPAESYLVGCWNCLGEFDALHAVWCSDDAKNPTKVCPFCFRCFCEATPRYKQEFWTRAPAPLVEELETLARSKDRLGDILIRMKKLTIPQLLEALIAQKKSGKKLGEMLVERGLVTAEDVQTALATQGLNPLSDTTDPESAEPGAAPGGARPYWEQASPEAILDYLLKLAARKGASDLTLEPREDQISVRYRIDGFSFRVDSIPKHLQDALTDRLFDTFHLDPDRGRPQTARITSLLGNEEYDIVAQALPSPHGVSVSVKLIHRGSFIKDFATLGLEMDDRVRLIEELQSAFGLVLVTSPAFCGSNTTAYAIMNHLVQSHRDVLSLESPIHWQLDGARQVEVEAGPGGPRMEEALHSVMAVRPDVLMLSAVPDQGTAVAATQIASSRLVVATETAQSAAQGLVAFQERGASSQQLAGSLSAVTGQRLVRTICRNCRTDAEPPAAQTLAAHGINEMEAGTLSFYRGQGCSSCNNVGYRGRRAIFEVLPGAPEVRGAVSNGLSASELEAMATAAGMTPIRDRCLHLVREGVTTFDEFARLRL